MASRPYSNDHRHAYQGRDAARLNEEDRRFALINQEWDEATLRQACLRAGIEANHLNKDAMQTMLISRQVHIIQEDQMVADAKTGELAWSDPFNLFGPKPTS